MFSQIIRHQKFMQAIAMGNQASQVLLLKMTFLQIFK